MVVPSFEVTVCMENLLPIIVCALPFRIIFAMPVSGLEELNDDGRESSRGYGVVLAFQDMSPGIGHTIYKCLSTGMEKRSALAANDHKGWPSEGRPAFGRQRFPCQEIFYDHAIVG